MGLVLLETWIDSPVTLRGFYNHCQKQLINPTAIRVLWRHPGPNEDIYVLLWSPPLWPQDWAGNPRCYKPTNCDFYFLPVTPNLDLTQLGSSLMSNGLKKPEVQPKLFYDFMILWSLQRWRGCSTWDCPNPGMRSAAELRVPQDFTATELCHTIPGNLSCSRRVKADP